MVEFKHNAAFYGRRACVTGILIPTDHVDHLMFATRSAAQCRHSIGSKPVPEGPNMLHAGRSIFQAELFSRVCLRSSKA
jgi:hypothetical protein